MNNITVIFLAIGLAMDSFAVSISNAMCYQNMNKKMAFLDALFFGIAQAIMPLIGWGLGQAFMQYIQNIDHYIALILLGYIGIKMIIEAIKKKKDPGIRKEKENLNGKMLFIQAIATSIDALAVGISFTTIAGELNILIGVAMIGVITFICSGIGIGIGKRFGGLLEEKAEILGGCILCFIGLKIFIEHMFF